MIDQEKVKAFINKENEQGIEISSRESQYIVMLFSMYLDAVIKGEYEDPRRYGQELIESYNCTDQSPFYYMFAGFVGAVDLLNELLDN